MMKNAVFYLVLFAIGGCKTQQNPIMHTDSITGAEWKLVRLNGEDVAALNPPITLSFDEAQKKVSGFAGCNRFFGGYELNQSSIKFSAIGATKMYCQDKSSIEDNYVTALSNVQSFKAENSKLVLTGENAILEFTK